MTNSPYTKLKAERWLQRTEELIAAHPLHKDEIVSVVISAWDSIFESRIGGFAIGADIFPKPQIMGFLLHELVPLELESRHPQVWCIDKTGQDKDLVYLPNPALSVEIKTSAHATQVFGNRSYAQPTPKSKKTKAGYYLTINFEGFKKSKDRPRVRFIRFGWLDHSDWVAQEAPTGQQAKLRPIVYQTKLLRLYPA